VTRLSAAVAAIAGFLVGVYVGAAYGFRLARFDRSTAMEHVEEELRN
jgi:hypothetical protein